MFQKKDQNNDGVMPTQSTFDQDDEPLQYSIPTVYADPLTYPSGINIFGHAANLHSCAEPFLTNNNIYSVNMQPPPYTPIDDNKMYPSAPSYEYAVNYPNTQQEFQEQRQKEKDDLDLFKYTAPCKKTASMVIVIIGILIVIVFIILLVLGKL